MKTVCKTLLCTLMMALLTVSAWAEELLLITKSIAKGKLLFGRGAGFAGFIGLCIKTYIAQKALQNYKERNTRIFLCRCKDFIGR